MQLKTQSELARLAGCTTGAVSGEITHGMLKPACQGKFVDVDHPAVTQWLERRAVELARGYQRGRHAKRLQPQKRAAELREEAREYSVTRDEQHKEDMDRLAKNVRELAHMSLSELVYHFGQDVRFLEWLKALKEIENVEQKRTKNAKERGELVRADVVHVGFFMVIDQLFRQLLNEGAKNIARKTQAMVKADREVGEITEYIRQVFGTYFENAKKKMHNTLDELEQQTRG